jgi:hypothetical protein
VLQDSVLSPELFNRYIDDLATQLSSLGFQIYYYAEDLALSCCGLPKLRQAINIIEKWCRLNLMELNKKRCGILFLSSSRRQLTQWETILHSVCDIPIVAEYKYLGAVLSKNLSSPVNLERLSQKIKSFECMTFILRKQGAPANIIQML